MVAVSRGGGGVGVGVGGYSLEVTKPDSQTAASAAKKKNITDFSLRKWTITKNIHVIGH